MGPERQGRAFVQCDFEIIGSMVGYLASLGFTEYVRKSW